MAQHAPFAGAINPRGVGKMRWDGADRRGEDHHGEGCAYDTIRQNDQEQREIVAKVDRRKAKSGGNLIEQAGG